MTCGAFLWKEESSLSLFIQDLNNWRPEREGKTFASGLLHKLDTLRLNDQQNWDLGTSLRGKRLLVGLSGGARSGIRNGSCWPQIWREEWKISDGSVMSQRTKFN